jgi:CheY-like chemotaxis protein
MANIRILVAEDSPIDRVLVRRLLEGAGWAVEMTGDGREALERLTTTVPDVVVTDMLMPNVDGLKLVEELHSSRPSLPVLLMTAHGSEDVALSALRAGATSYVLKAHLARELVPTVRGLLELTRPVREQQKALSALRKCDAQFTLGNDPAEGATVAGQIDLWLTGCALFDDSTRLQVNIALREALANAALHGNLELDSALRGLSGEWEHTLAQRLDSDPYRQRRVQLDVQLDTSQVTLTVSDEGAGFDVARMEKLADELELDRVHGRGLLLMRTFMDEVTHNPSGSTVTLVKRRTRPTP